MRDRERERGKEGRREGEEKDSKKFVHTVVGPTNLKSSGQFGRPLTQAELLGCNN